MINYLGKKIKVKMDRPLGSKHPKYDLIYPINYGYIEGTESGDAEEIDAYVLGEFGTFIRLRRYCYWYNKTD